MPDPTPPSPDEYLSLSSEAYTLAGLTDGLLPIFDGMKVIARSDALIAGSIINGFEAIAVENAQGQVFIVNEGTVPDPTSTFGEGTLEADIAICEGETAPALLDAATFANDVEKQLGGSTPIYVTGHSLGGVEAEAEAQAIVNNPLYGDDDFAGGATFGATGLPQLTAGEADDSPSSLINYVDRGDMVGNFALDTETETPNALASNTAYDHYGDVDNVGPVSHAALLKSAQSNFTMAQAWDQLAAQGADGGSAADVYAGLATIDDSFALYYHGLTNYAHDVGSLYSQAAPIDDDLAWITQETAAFYGDSNAGTFLSQTVDSNEVITPYFTTSFNSTTDQITIDQTADINTSQGTAASGGVTTLSFDTSTGLAESATYASEDGSTYDFTFDEATGNPETLAVNENNGASYQTTYSYNTDGSFTSTTTAYSGASLTGDVQLTQIASVAADGTISDTATTLEPGASATIPGPNNSITYDVASSGSLAVDAGSFTPATSYTDSGTQDVSLATPSGTAIATLAFNASTDADSVSFGDGLSIALSGITNDVIAAVSGSDSPLQTLVAYLTDLADTTSDSALDALNTAYLYASGLPSQGTTVNLSSHSGVVNQSEFNALTSITGTGTITAAASGTYDLAAKNVTGDVTDLLATDWLGTTLIGNNQNSQTLTASLLGDDTLYAGNGSGDELKAGQGQDMLVGGTGGDTFLGYSPDGLKLADGSFVVGDGTGNTLEVDGDITRSTVIDIQTLDTSNITLTADQFAGFTAVNGLSGMDTLNAATGGTYDLGAVDSSFDDWFNMTALTNDGTTLITDANGQDQTLTASATGTDTLETAGTGDTLVAGGGIDTLIGGDGTTFMVANGLAAGSSVEGNGVDETLNATGDISGATISDVNNLVTNGVTLTASQFNGFSTISSFDGNGGTIYAASASTYNLGTQDDSLSNTLNMTALSNGGTTLIGNDAGGETLTASATGNDTLTAGNGGEDYLIAGSGNDTLNAGTGSGDVLVAGTGVDTLNAGGGGTLIEAFNGLAAGSVLTGGYELDVSGDISGATLSGDEILNLVGNVKMTSAQYSSNLIIGSGTYTIVDAGDTAASAAALAGETGITPVAVTDTSANVQTNLDALQTLAADSELASVTFTDPTPPILAITATQSSSDTDALAAISGTYHLAVTGVTATDASTVAAETNVISVAVSDTAANVTSNITSLQTLAAAGSLSSTSFTDSGTPTLSFSATDAATDIDAIATFTGSFTLAVSDTAANVVTNIDALGELAAIGDLTSIVLTDGGTPTLDLTATQVGDDAAALVLITSAYTVAVSDTGDDVAANLDALQALATAGTLSSITLTDSTTPTLSITQTQLSGDSGALAAIGSSYTLAIGEVLAVDAATVAATTGVTSVSVADTAANVQSNLSALETLAAASTLSAIFFTDTDVPTLSVTETQLISDADALALIAGSYNLAVTSVAAADADTVAAVANVTSISISDTAANVVANLDELQALANAGQLGTITLTDSGTPTLSLSQAQLATDADAIAAISGSYYISLSSVFAASAATVAAESGVTSVAVTDTAANIVSNLAALETLAGDSELASITLIDPGTPTLTITASQLSSDASVFSLISGSYDLAVTGVSAANAATVAAESHVTSVSVSDTAVNVVSNIDSLETAAGDVSLSIALTDGGTPTLTITGTQFSSDSGALSAITSAYHLTVTSVLAANVATVGANSHVTSITVSDTAANVATSIDSLESVASKLATFALTDSGTPTMTISYTQLINDATALGKISGTFDITVSNTLAANAATAATKTHVTSILVSDTAAHVTTSLSSLETLATAGTLTSVSFTDTGTPTLTLTYTQFSGDTALLATFATAYDLAITGVSAANAATVAANTHVTLISVSDTSANVASNIDSLETIASQINTLAVTDGTNTITITALQAANDYAALSQLTGTYKIGISDTAANISAHFDALQTLETFSGTKLTITPSDGGTNNINISATQAVNDAGAIGRLAAGTFHITVTDTAANVSANFATLQALVSPTVKLNDIVLTDSGTPTVSVTYTQYTATTGTTVLGDIAGSYHIAVSAVTIAHITTVLGGTNVTSVSVSDTAANIGANLNTLQTDAAAGTVTGITVTNPTALVSFTYTQLSSDATALGLFTGTYSFNVTAVTYANAATVLAESHVATVNISDTAANVSAHIDALQTLFAASQISGIVLTDAVTPSMTMTATQGANDTGAINAISSAFHLTISDTAANVQSNLNGLEALFAAIGTTDFTAITLTDGTEPTITLSASQITSDASVINKITSAYHLTVSDTAANVVANLTALQSLNAKITSIVLTDGGTPNLAITGTQYFNDLTAINKITSAYTLTVSATAAANATTVGGNSHTTSFTVSDTAGNIGTQFAGLLTETTSGKLTAITITTGTLTTITYSQYTSGSTTLALITNASYNLSVSGVSIANSATVLAGAHIVSVNISDTAANVQSNIDSLETIDAAGSITGIVLTDGGTPTITITATQATNDKTAIVDITSAHHLTVNDTAANVWANIAGLVALGPNLTSVTLTDGGTPNFSITGAQYATDINIFNAITTPYTLTVSAASASQGNTVGANSHVTSWAVNDTAATVVADLGLIEPHTSTLSAITLTDSGTPVVSVTGTQLNSDSAAIAKITTTYNETVKADANTTESLTGTGSINTVSFASEAQGVTANLGTGTATTVHSGTTNTYTLADFMNVTGSTLADTLTAGSSGGILTGNGGADTYVLNASSGYDIAQDTAAHLNGTTIQNFSVLDGIDLTNFVYSGSDTLGFTENGAGTQGTLTVSNASVTTTLTLLGNYANAFQTTSDGGAGTLVTLSATTHLTDILAAAHA